MSNPTFYSYRLACLEDAADLQRFCWPERSPQAVREFLRRTLPPRDEQNAYALVAEYKGHAVAYGMLSQQEATHEITDLIVTHSLRDKGIGSHLIHLLLQQAHSWGLPSVEIGARAVNPRAQALYERLGFRPHREAMINFGYDLERVIFLVIYLR